MTVKDAMIRKSTPRDASRVAEILVFTKRVNYRAIFNDDIGSFVDLQVYPLAKAYIENPDALRNVWVFDDGIVKGMLHAKDGEIVELYVDSFFEGQGIGGQLIEFAVRELNCTYLWVLDKNVRAKRFYQSHGFRPTGEQRPEGDTGETIVLMRRQNEAN